MPNDREQKIRERAYEFYLKRGEQKGYSLEDWYRAEADIVSRFYLPSAPGALRQCEILSNVAQVLPVVGSLFSGTAPQVKIQTHPLVVIFSQDCDLLQDFQVREKKEPSEKPATDKLLPSVLLCQATGADELMASIMGKDIKKRIYQNKDERYQYLRAIEPAQDVLKEGLQSMILDFKRYFTLATDDLYYQLETTAKRRAVLNSPYLEHLTTRFFNFQARVALSEDHY